MLMKLLENLFLFIFILNSVRVITGSDVQVSCKNERGENVDWYYLYKIPSYYSDDKTEHLASDGLSYLYLTNSSFNKWKLSESNVNKSSSMPAQTLEPLFADPSVFLLAYNDEFPSGQVVAGGGHTKGVIATDGNTGIWFVHSVPKFPSVPIYEYPATGTHYGQSLFCITLNATEMESVGKQLLFNEPNIYYQRVPPALIAKFPYLEKVIQKQWVHMPPYNSVLDIKSLQGSVFKTFAKSSKFNQELYEDFVAPTLATNLLVETWRHGGGNFHSNCSLNDKVYNVEEIQLPHLKLSFPSTLDHSKWAVSESVGWKFWRWLFPYKSNWLCVGDINRQHHQLTRGGGVVCQRNENVAKLFRNLVKKYESCRSKFFFFNLKDTSG